MALACLFFWGLTAYQIIREIQQNGLVWIQTTVINGQTVSTETVYGLLNLFVSTIFLLFASVFSQNVLDLQDLTDFEEKTP